MYRTIAGIAIALTLAAPAVEAKQCKDKRVTGISTGATPIAIPAKKAAEIWAHKHWDQRCAQLFPGIWCDREIAIGSRMRCNRQPNGVGGYNHNCEFSAKPCRK